MSDYVFAQLPSGKSFKVNTIADQRYISTGEMKKNLRAAYRDDFGSPRTYFFSFGGDRMSKAQTSEGLAAGSSVFVLKCTPPSVFCDQFQLDTNDEDGHDYTFRDLKLQLLMVSDAPQFGNPNNTFFVFAGKGLNADFAEIDVATPLAGKALRDDDTAKGAEIVDRSVICLIKGSPVKTVQWTWGDLWSGAYKNPLRWSQISNITKAIADLGAETGERPVKFEITRDDGTSTVEDYTTKSAAIAAAKFHFARVLC